jgi:hypothetical protein
MSFSAIGYSKYDEEYDEDKNRHPSETGSR